VFDEIQNSQHQKYGMFGSFGLLWNPQYARLARLQWLDDRLLRRGRHYGMECDFD
jgi:hypothetical protein